MRSIKVSKKPNFLSTLVENLGNSVISFFNVKFYYHIVVLVPLSNVPNDLLGKEDILKYIFSFHKPN